MLATLTTRALMDRWRGVTIGAVSMGLMLALGMAAYRELDLSLYTNLPAAFRDMIGIAADADVASLSYNAIYASYGTLVLASLTIAMGAASVAGEERAGTVGVLLANPRSRTQVVLAKTVAMVTLTLLAAVVLWLAAVVSPALLSVQVGSLHLAALVVHMAAGALFYGALALAVSAWTGSVGRAIGVSTAVMILSFFAVGLLPLFGSVADLVRLFPWHYVNGAEPLVNGASVRDLAVLFGASVLLLVVAVYGVNHRDLRQPTAGAGLLDRLRGHPLAQQALARLSTGTRVSRLWVKTATDHQAVTLIVALTMFTMMGLLMGPMFAAIEDTLAGMSNLPDAILAIAGGGDMSTPEGWYQLETFGLMAPISVMVVTVLIGSRGLAGEESQRTMGILLANPIRRSRVVLDKTVAMVVLALVIGAATFAGVAGGSAIAGLGMHLGNIAATATLQVLIGLFFGGLALALSAGTGRTRTATMGTIGVALVAYLVNTFGLLSDRLAGIAAWGPFHWYLGGNPLTDGIDWGGAAKLGTGFVALVAAAVWLFERRDLRNDA